MIRYLKGSEVKGEQHKFHIIFNSSQIGHTQTKLGPVVLLLLLGLSPELRIELMAHSHCTGTGPGTGTGRNVHIAQGLELGTRPGNIMHATEIHYKVPQGNTSGPEIWVGNPLQIFLFPFPVPIPVQCEQFCVIYSNPLLLVWSRSPFRAM